MKKVISTLLCVVMLAASLCACNPSDVSENPEETESTPTETAPHGIPEELDFGGESFNICNDGWIKNLYYVEEYSSDNMEAAVYNRNKKAENFLNIKIGYAYQPGYEELRTLFQAGDDIYQEYVLKGQDNSTFLLDGLLYNVDKLPYINFDAEWWDKENTDILRVGKYTYLMVSDYLIVDPLCVYFNRDMVEDNNLPDPYEMVPAGTWTIDKYIDMAIAVRNDVNGDGDFLGEDDIIGIYTNGSWYYMALPTASARFMTERDENNRIISDMGDEFTYAFLDQIYRLYENPGSFHYASDKYDYANGNVLFTMGQISALEGYATIDAFTAGVVPSPKFNEEQTRYYSLDWSGALAVPSTIKNKELVGAFNEYMAWESGNEVIPTYYEKLLKTRFSADLETRQMVELLFDTTYIEPGINYMLFSGFTGHAYICNLPLGGTKAYAAYFRRENKLIKKALVSFYEGLDAIEALEGGTSETEAATEAASN